MALNPVTQSGRPRDESVKRALNKAISGTTYAKKTALNPIDPRNDTTTSSPTAQD